MKMKVNKLHKIVELEELNTNLKSEIKEKGITIHTLQVGIGKLKNKNAELEEENATLRAGKQQLTKAEEIIKNILHTLKNEDSEFTFALKNTHPVLTEAEQFLMEVSE